jgi:hypothetical protein
LGRHAKERELAFAGGKKKEAVAAAAASFVERPELNSKPYSVSRMDYSGLLPR